MYKVHQIGKPHPILTVCIPDARDAVRIPIKLKLLTGTYTLQSNKATFNQFQVDPICRLCKLEPETRKHMIVSCASLQNVRKYYIQMLRDILVDTDVPQHLVLNHPDLLTQLILDPTSDKITEKIALTKSTLQKIVNTTHKMLFTLHNRRITILNSSA